MRLWSINKGQLSRNYWCNGCQQGLEGERNEHAFRIFADPDLRFEQPHLPAGSGQQRNGNRTLGDPQQHSNEASHGWLRRA